MPSAAGGLPGAVGGTPSATGFEQRADGLVHRVRVVTCENTLPRLGFHFGELTNSACNTDADCAQLKYGYCDAIEVRGAPLTAKCFSGCVEDADCDAGQICYCGTGIGKCVASTCTADADCKGELCAFIDDWGHCDDGSRRFTEFACTTPGDECLFALDCPTFRCGLASGARACLEELDRESTCAD